MDSLVSIIVPVYNSEQYLDGCINSILNQSYPLFELILINDGSKDRSLEICRSYENRDNRVVVIDQNNGGASSARNAGLDRIHGDYVTFVDADDFVSPQYLDHLLRGIQKSKSDIIQCNLKYVKIKSSHIKVEAFRSSNVRKISKIQALNYRLYKVSVWAKLYRADLFRNYRFQTGIIFEDDDSYYRLVDQAESVALLDETLYYYYMSENSVMRNGSVDKRLDFISIYQDRIRYFQQRDDQILLGGSYDRFCLVLMLFLSSTYSYGWNEDDAEKLLRLYYDNYPKAVCAKKVKFLDKLYFSIFRIAPRQTGMIIGKIRGRRTNSGFL